MIDQKNAEADSRKDWIQPELKRLEAGAAEAGNRVNEDGGDALAGPRS